MLIVLTAKKRFGFWIRFNYSRIVNYSELPIPTSEPLGSPPALACPSVVYHLSGPVSCAAVEGAPNAPSLSMRRERAPLVRPVARPLLRLPSLCIAAFALLPFQEKQLDLPLDAIIALKLVENGIILSLFFNRLKIIRCKDSPIVKSIDTNI